MRDKSLQLETTISPFANFLSGYTGSTVYLELMRGNNGDKLIHEGIKLILSSSGCCEVSHPEKADLILINGSGAMHDLAAMGLDYLIKYRQSYPLHPLAVAPSTFRFRGIQAEKYFSPKETPLYLFARTQKDLQYISDAKPSPNVFSAISKDLALELEGSEFLSKLLTGVRPRWNLIALRKDNLGAAGGFLSQAKGSRLPRAIRRPLSRARDWLVASRSRSIVEEILRKEKQGRHRAGTTYTRDISVSVSFDEFLEAIAGAQLIITDRIHVAILGNLLDKRVYLLSDLYHKNASIYEANLSGPGSKTVFVDRNMQMASGN